jgi:hypothetical protein
MEDNLDSFFNGRRPQFFFKGRRPQFFLIEEDLKKNNSIKQ